jgi:hypothetical protein
MSSGIVKFKFKHQNVFDKIEFPSSEITVAELRIKIQEKLLMTEGGGAARNSSVLEILKIGTEEPYEWDHELIPSHTSVLVSRAPAKAVQKIIVHQQAQGNEAVSGEDVFALKPSIIQSELDSVRRVPQIAVCELCSWIMVRTDHYPVILSCCGKTICHACVSKSGNTCPVENRDPGKPVTFVTDRAVERIVNVITCNKTAYVFDSVSVPPDFLVESRFPETGPEDTTVEVVDVDEFEPEVFDVDNPRPLNAKEIEALERRERRKRKALEILAKREGAKAVKGELTEADINRLLKTELKSELSVEGFSGQPGEEADEQSTRRRPIVIEYPKLLTPEQFGLWKSQQSI